MSTRYLLVMFALVGCESSGGGATASTTSTGAKLAESGTKRGSAGGFSATLAQQLGPPEGSLGAAAPSTQPAGAAPAPSGSGATAAPTEGTKPPAERVATASAGSSASAERVATPAAGSTVQAGGSAVAAATSSSAPAANGAASGAAASAAAETPGPESTPAVAAKTGGSTAKREQIKPPADIAAIKLDLEPNWERDSGEAGTFSLVVKVPNTEASRVFSVKYGYEDQSAPVDCDQYRKFLEEKKIMTVTLNRQRGGACYVESSNAYRYLVNYGGKRLMCTGSLYKDGASASLGDLRDKVLMQAKKICETLAL